MDAILSAVPVWGLVALGVLVVIETALDVIALVDLYRRPIGVRAPAESSFDCEMAHEAP